jgi:hypothetical protein
MIQWRLNCRSIAAASTNPHRVAAQADIASWRKS